MSLKTALFALFVVHSCNTCGYSLGFRVADASIEEIELAMASFDEDLPVKIDAQIYTKYKANWCELQTDLPVFSDQRVS